MSRRFSRRSLLRRSGIAAAGLGLWGCRGEPGEPDADALSQGLPAEYAAALLPEAARPDGVLDLFLLGGLNPFDTFYVVPEYGVPEPGSGGQGQGGPNGDVGQMWWAFQEGQDSIPDWHARCGGGDRPLLVPFGTDALGMTVNLGPFLYPLRDRPDILSRMRILVMRHGETTHQSGVPFALCGHRRNTPRLAGTGVHVEAHLRGLEGVSSVPRSYVFLPGLSDLSGLNADAAAATGLQRASARPLTLRLGPEGVNTDQLLRTIVGGNRSAIDRTVDLYTQRYAGRLVAPDGRPIRSEQFDDYAAARAGLLTTPDAVGLLSPEALAAREGQECDQHSGTDFTGMGLQAAVELLTHPTSPARYVTSVDGGLAPASGGGAYDTHFFHVQESARNVVHMSRELVNRINEPGEGDPRKLDLDRHLVLLTTEYGRSPLPIAGGLDHWPYGYVVIAIGGPVTEDHSGIIGAIDGDAYATSWFTPGDQRAALLLALGIWPFSDRSFAVGDISAGATELDCAMFLREELWGYRS